MKQRFALRAGRRFHRVRPLRPRFAIPRFCRQDIGCGTRKLFVLDDRRHIACDHIPPTPRVAQYCEIAAYGLPEILATFDAEGTQSFGHIGVFQFQKQFRVERFQIVHVETTRCHGNFVEAHEGGQLVELADSIKERGIIQPIVVRAMKGAADQFEIVAGERRWRAAQRAGLHEAPVVIRDLTDDEAAEIALIENIQRVDLSPLEEAAAYQRLADVYKRTQDEIASAVGKSRSHIANMMRLGGLTPKCRAALEAGEISMGHARALLAARDPDGALKTVIGKGLNVREAEALVRRQHDLPAVAPAQREPSKPSVPGRKDADARALEADLAAALGLEVEIEHTPRGSGAMTIRYRTLDQLDDVCKRLMGAGV